MTLEHVVDVHHASDRHMTLSAPTISKCTRSGRRVSLPPGPTANSLGSITQSSRVKTNRILSR